MHWQATTVEAQRLQRELDKLQLKFDDCIQERVNFETKLLHARRLLESESKERRRLVRTDSYYNKMCGCIEYNSYIYILGRKTIISM